MMAGNTFGQVFRVTTFGESHGYAVGAVVDGCPALLALTPSDFVRDMRRRQPGRRPHDSPRGEDDQVEILSGVFEGKTTGAPITLLVRNRDVDSRPYEILREVFRPGHGDFTYFKKYGHFDFRGSGRYSARETAARVAAGVVAEKVLAPVGIRVVAYTLELGGIRARDMDLSRLEENAFFCPDLAASREMEKRVSEVKAQGDSLGGIAEILITGCPAGLGEPVFDKLDADLAKAVMSVGTVKGVEVGAGFESARLTGSRNNDPITSTGFAANRAGGILGGISNGDEIVLRAAMKPIPSIGMIQQTTDRAGKDRALEMQGRFDVCAIPRVIPVLEAMVKMVLADHYLRFRCMG
jgi:chorismate synthase